MTTQRVSFRLLATLALVAILSGSTTLCAQENPDPAAASDTASSDPAAPPATSADPAAPEAQPDATPAEPMVPPTAEPTAPPATGAEPATSDAPATDATTQPGEAPATSPASTTDEAADKAAVEQGGSSWAKFQIVLILLALFIVPIIVGNFIAKALKMPDYGWKIALMIGALAASVVAISTGKFRGGPDLSGGITLIYELVDSGSNDETEKPDQQQPTNQAASAKNFKLNEVIAALKKRIDPTGTKEVVIRSSGNNAIEVVVPNSGETGDLEYIKRMFTEMGNLEFRITADSRRSDDKDLIEQALRLPPGQKVLTANGRKVAEWVELDPNEFDTDLNTTDFRGLAKRMANGRVEGLVKIDLWNVTGDYLTSSGKGYELGRPIVQFSFDSEGAQRFGELTGENVSSRGQEHYLGIILDKRLISAPSINSRITSSGQISGASMQDREVDHIIDILNAGKLPAELAKDPLSQEVTSPQLGAETIRKGAIAIVASLIFAILFVVVYYRFAGLVAAFALIANLFLTVGTMYLIGAHFTLPGLAGLVLTIGMSVDANVLIFERMREELDRGAALRMAIRNGFSRASVTIIDSNLATLITGFVLYAVGSDQLRSFAVTLMIGIVMSMFTAIFCSRIIFDIAERRRWITSLKMMRVFTHANYDFMSLLNPALIVSGILIAIGLAAVYMRGSDLLDIDFTGGTSVTMVLKDDAKMPLVEVEKKIVEQSDLEDFNLLVVELGTDNTRFTIDSSIDSVDKIKEILQDVFKGQLQTYAVEVRDIEPYTEGEITGTEAKIAFGTKEDESAGVTYNAVLTRLQDTLKSAGHEGILPQVTAPEYTTGSGQRIKEWDVRIELPVDSTRPILENIASEMSNEPVFPMANKIGSKVAGNLQARALIATFISLAGVMGYIWLRFQNFAFSLGAVIALIHDVLVMVGLLALSQYFVDAFPAVASFLKIDAFQIGLAVLAAILTLIGYSLNDTIVTFDRIREVKGKSPRLTPEMINLSINQTLGRTILTFFVTFMVVFILYVAGGPGIHAFSFALLVGVIAGTYSSIFIAAPILLWIVGDPTTQKQP